MEIPIRPRRIWTMLPFSRVKESAKVYDRKREKRVCRREIEVRCQGYARRDVF